MKLSFIAAALSAIALVLTSPSSAPSPVLPVGGGEYYKIVRAEYIDLSGNLLSSRTTCFIQNLSATTPITLKEVYVLGAGGVNQILGTYTGLVGTVLPPLGQARVVIDNSIQGVTTQTSLSGPGVANVVTGWEGPPDVMKLSTVLERQPGGNTDARTHMTEDGIPLVW